MIENLIRVPLIEESTSTKHDKLAIASYGPPGSGKTHFCLSAPVGKHSKGGLGIIPLERKSKPTFQKENKLRSTPKRLYFPSYDLIRHENPMQVVSMKGDCKEDKEVTNTPQPPKCCEIHYYRWHRIRFLAAYYSMLEVPYIETVIIDSGSQLKEDLLMAHYGRTQRILSRDRGLFNQDWTDILNAGQHKHLIITHHPSDVWKNDKPTGQTTWDGYNKLGHGTNLIIKHSHDPKEQKWSMECVLCTNRPELIGHSLPCFDIESDDEFPNEELTFQNVAMSVYSDADPEDYE